MKTKEKQNRGFTMVELLIAISVFLVVTAISTGGFIRSLRSQKSVFALISANSNSSLTVEQITREVRTGYNFCTAGFETTCSPQIFGDGIKTERLRFINERNEIITYALQDGAITRTVGITSAPEKITADNVSISNLKFILQNNQTGNPDPDGAQTRITILFTASGIGRDIEGVSFDFQTTISPRQLDTFASAEF